MHHYLGWTYVTENRFKSFYWQISEVLSFKPLSVLEIGKGSGVVAAVLSERQLSVRTVDIDPCLTPDIVASVDNLPIRSESFDVAICCQVLEHLEFSMLEHYVRELARVASKGIVISLPNAFPFYKLEFALPVLGSRRYSISRTFGPTANPENMNPSHKWEIGYAGIRPSDVVTVIERIGLRFIREYRLQCNPYHHFFIAGKL